MEGYIVFLTIYVAMYALFGLGLNLQWGFTGLINFGHVAFMTVGAYTTVLLSVSNVPLPLAVLAGAVLAALLGLLIGLSTLRLREDYLAIVTIGVSEVIRLIALNEEWLTRGTFGIQKFPIPLEAFRPTVFSRVVMIAILTVIVGLAYWQLWQWVRRRLKQSDRSGWVKDPTLILAGIFAVLGVWLYGTSATVLYNYSRYLPKSGLLLISVLVLAIVFWWLEVLVRSPWGRVLKAIREDEEVAKALGKNVFWYKLQSLMLGGFIAGIAGAIFAWQISTIYPENFAPLITFDAWTLVVLGGAGNNVGTLLGAALFGIYTSLTRFVLPAIVPLDDAQLGAFRVMVIGLLLMVLMIWRPQGILGKKEELTLGR
jgi:neutral amino acid transport system permease protein